MKTIHEMFDYGKLNRVKYPIFSVIVLVSILIMISTEATVSVVPLRYRIVSALTKASVDRVEGNNNSSPNQEQADRVEAENNSIIPPSNLTRKGRILWFKRKLPELDIFNSDKITRRFDTRVKDFFDKQCEVRFFTSWISSVRSFRIREILAMESIFKAHPKGCLIILSRTMDSMQGYNIIKPLLDNGFKILAVTPDLPLLFNGTSANGWFKKLKDGNVDPGEIPLAQNLSNLIRLTVLYKYGGVYLDTDFIVTRNSKSLRNSLGAQSVDPNMKWTRLNKAVLVFDRKHPLLLKFIEEFASTFDGNRWGHNGPYLVSRVVERIQGKPGYYNNFNVMPPLAFYPVDWSHIRRLFKKPRTHNESRRVDAKLRQLEEENTYGIHLWNKQSGKFPVEEKSVIQRLITDHCVICRRTTLRS